MRGSRANLCPDVSYRFRHLVGPWITRLARALGQPAYRLRGTEYVATVHDSIDEFARRLQAAGFSWGPVSWYHQPPVGTTPDGSWTYRPSPLADRQIHVVLCARAHGRIDVYAHEEYNWLRHPVKHVRQVGIRREEGATQVRRWLDAQDLDADYKSRTRRRISGLVSRCGESLLAHVRAR